LEHAMRSIIVAAVSLFVLTATPAGAQSSFDAAGTTCAQFVKARASDTLHRQASNWLWGYASGLTAGLTAGKNPAVVTLTNDQLLKSAADYCQANPGATIANAASAWVPQPQPESEPPPSQGFFFNLKRPTQPGGRQ
jgi:hypothetical protein